MSAEILDGRALADSIRSEIAREVESLLPGLGLRPCLAVVLVGNHAASEVYVRNKRKACEQAGITSVLRRLSADCSESELLEEISSLNSDPAVHGILVQLPLPRQIEDSRIIDSINPLKDVDGFHPQNLGLMAMGRPRLVACTPLGVRELLIRHGVVTRGSRAVVLGRSNIVGRPMALLLMQRGEGGDATVTVCHSSTVDPASITREADLLIVAMGRPEAVRAEWVKPGATVIDVGIHRRDDGTLCGDVLFDEVSRVAGRITPVPGGVGPMTIAMLLKNTVMAARLQSSQ